MAENLGDLRRWSSWSNVIRTVKLNMMRPLFRYAFSASANAGQHHGLVAVGAGGDHADLRAGLLLVKVQIILRGLRQLVELGDAFGGGRSSP